MKKNNKNSNISNFLPIFAGIASIVGLCICCSLALHGYNDATVMETTPEDINNIGKVIEEDPWENGTMEKIGFAVEAEADDVISYEHDKFNYKCDKCETEGTGDVYRVMMESLDEDFRERVNNWLFTQGTEYYGVGVCGGMGYTYEGNTYGVFLDDEKNELVIETVTHQTNE